MLIWTIYCNDLQTHRSGKWGYFSAPHYSAPHITNRSIAEDSLNVSEKVFLSTSTGTDNLHDKAQTFFTPFEKYANHCRITGAF